jgi:tetratricopeptide (TPR) repeat protein
MAGHTKLDAPRRAQSRGLIHLAFFLLALAVPARAQELPSDAARLAAAQKAFDSQQWAEAARIASGPQQQLPDLDLLAGLALAKLERWSEAQQAFEAGHRKAPADARFLVELAGVAYKQKNSAAAKQDLHTALRLNPRDSYAHDFLGTIYFLDGNIEAALKYWNGIEKPHLRAVNIVPEPKLDKTLLERAVAFNAPQILTRDALLTTEARLDNLGVFSQRRIELAPSSPPANSDSYDATVHLHERNDWGDSKLGSLLSIFGALPYSTVHPNFYNLDHAAVNFLSLARWDSQKRRVSVSLSSPLFRDPASRFRIYFDARNENWNLAQTFFGAGGLLGDLNLRRISGGAEYRQVESGRWAWNTGFEVAHRSFRNLAGHTSPAELPFFTGGTSFSYWLRAERSLVRVPEHRFVLDSSARASVGRDFAPGLGSSGSLRGSLEAHWFPQARGDDYEMKTQLRAGLTLGRVPLDDLFQLGVERDNDLWLRGHAGTTGGRKGAAPLGRRYFLANWEITKKIYGNGLFAVKLGPFLDNGAVADSSGLFGSRRWLVDAGLQCQMRLLGYLTVVLSYGRDLRGGKNVYFGSWLH